MYAISTDNDNQDNNYTRPGSSITVTYHLNNQALKRKKGREGRRDPRLGVLLFICQSQQSRLGSLIDRDSSGKSFEATFIGIHRGYITFDVLLKTISAQGPK